MVSRRPLLFSIVTLPLFLSTGVSGKSILSRLAATINKPWMLILLLVLSIAIIDVFIYPDGYWGYRNGGWNIIAYLLFFFFGYLIFANPKFMETIEKMRWITLGIGVVAFSSVMVVFLDELADPVGHFGSTPFAIASLVQSVNAWAWLLAMLGLGSRFLNRNNRFLSYANEAVLPFYILHQTVIISIGFYVVQWSAGVGLKYLVISTASFLAIMLIYEFLVRRINVLRFLFGMRLQKKAKPIRS